MVNVHHHETRQACSTLLAPAPLLASLRCGFIERRLEDEGWQLALQLGVARLTILVDVLVPFVKKIAAAWTKRLFPVP